ncbi:asparagine synthase [Streptomyces capparidis]
MLKLRIDHEELAALRHAWRWKSGRWHCGRSWVQPYGHPAVETEWATDGTATFLHVRERLRGRAEWSRPEADVASAVRYEQPGYRESIARARAWPGDWLLLETTPGRPVAITAGAHGIAPVYLVADRGVLHGSWDLADLRAHIVADHLVEIELARRLALRSRYTAQTLWTGVHQLTERATARFDGADIAVSYPEPAAHSRAREIKPGSDVVAAYEYLLDQVLADRVHDPASSAVQLSGGLDSANVAFALAARPNGNAATASALLLDQARGVQQARRRAEMIRLAGFRADVAMPALDHLPLHPHGPRGLAQPVSPYEDVYHEAQQALAGELARCGVRAVLTGIGGDEMVALTAEESPHPPLGTGEEIRPWIGARVREALVRAEDDIAPASLINETTLKAHACAAPPLLRHGLWPVHPLSDPRLVVFGEWLPIAWRRDKRLHRERLARLRLSPSVVRPRLAENFVGVMNEALRRHGAPYIARMLREGSVLIDQGFVDPLGLAATGERLMAGRLRHGDREVCVTLAFDAAVRAF